MKKLNIYEAKSNFSELVDKASKGHVFLIAKAGVPMAILSPLVANKKTSKFEFGAMAGQIIVSDDFDAPLPQEVIALFEGSAH